MSLNLQGVFAALTTPFNPQGEVDHEQLRRNIEQYNLTDLRGYVALGSTGEFPHLTADEKIAVIETTRGAMATDKLLIVGTSELSTRETIKLTNRAHELGADAALVVTPFYYKKVLHDEQHEAHYQRIADAAPLPVMIYQIPQFTGVYLLPETVAKLSEHPNIIGMKESSGDLPALKDVFRELPQGFAFDIMLGAPAILTEGFDIGCLGAILAVATIAPRAAVAVEQAYRYGYHERAAELQKALATLARKTTGGGLGGVKYAMDRVGLYGFLPRSPLPAPNEDEKAEIEKAIEESGFFALSEDGAHWIEQTVEIHHDYAD
jgi:4-hydroxy-2-oxoglutarate aldolase